MIMEIVRNTQISCFECRKTNKTLVEFGEEYEGEDSVTAWICPACLKSALWELKKDSLRTRQDD